MSFYFFLFQSYMHAFTCFYVSSETFLTWKVAGVCDIVQTWHVTKFSFEKLICKQKHPLLKPRIYECTCLCSTCAWDSLSADVDRSKLLFQQRRKISKTHVFLGQSSLSNFGFLKRNERLDVLKQPIVHIVIYSSSLEGIRYVLPYEMVKLSAMSR